MQVVLIMLRNGGERRSFSVVRDLTTIGRREDCDLRIPVGDVSRKHCRLVVTGGDTLRVQDLGSSNGTFVNGQQVQESVLAAGDTVSVGPVRFIVQIDGTPTEDELDNPIGLAGDTGAGGTAVAVDAMTAAAAAAGDGGDGAELSDLLEPPPDGTATVDEGDLITDDALVDPPAEPPLEDLPIGSSAEPAFAPVELDPAAAAAPPATAGDEWDFLIDEPEAGHEQPDLQIDLDQPHGH